MTQHKIAVIGTGFRAGAVAAVPPGIEKIAGPSFVPTLVPLRLNAFPATPFDRSLAMLANVDAGIRAAQQGADAILINTFGDYGIAELRSVLSIPVVGAGETSMMVASTLGSRFAIVTIWPSSLRFIYDERITACGMSQRCASLRYVLENKDISDDSGDAAVEKLRAGDAGLLDRVIEAARSAVRMDGVDTIVLGCTCMAPIASQVAAHLDVPVVEPMTAGYMYAESMVRLGMRHSRVAYPEPAAGRSVAASALIDGASLPDLSSDCPVCAIGDM
jgi:Asp/Glu/hydantoin racemase